MKKEPKEDVPIIQRHHLSVVSSAVLISTLLSTQVHCADKAAEINTLRINQEQNAKSGFQLAGYASFGYSYSEEDESNFDVVKFAPIFHYGYSDILQFEGELEFSITQDGETEVALEYAAANLFLNNYMTLTAGQFMSPIGQFRQNFHPSWINKLPTAPVGFGHGGAAPTSNVGLALRGGLPRLFSLRHNYVIYVANAPTIAFAPDGDVDIGAEGMTSGNGTSATVGGRYAIDPLSGMEIGISGAFGKAYDTNSSQGRDYNVFDVDFTYHTGGFDLRGEYVEQKIGTDEELPIEGGKWQAAYGQIAYQFDALHLEPVVRYGFYNNPEKEQKETDLGLNYLFANNIIAKFAYSFGDVTEGGDTESTDKYYAQLAFGF